MHFGDSGDFTWSLCLAGTSGSGRLQKLPAKKETAGDNIGNVRQLPTITGAVSGNERGWIEGLAHD